MFTRDYILQTLLRMWKSAAFTEQSRMAWDRNCSDKNYLLLCKKFQLDYLKLMISCLAFMKKEKK